MKKSLAFVFLFLIIVFIILFMRFKDLKRQNLDTMSFNSDYEIFNIEQVNGLDVATAINKAISNNEKYAVSKDENEYYDINDNYCVEVYVSVIMNDSGDAKTVRMENFNKNGMGNFISLYADVKFKCTNIEYNSSTGKVKSITFKQLES